MKLTRVRGGNLLKGTLIYFVDFDNNVEVMKIDDRTWILNQSKISDGNATLSTSGQRVSTHSIQNTTKEILRFL
jgi:hypothetical protein